MDPSGLGRYRTKSPEFPATRISAAFFQWTGIEIAGYDAPLILGAVPVVRSRKRADIVPGIGLMLMDREFAHDA